MTRRVYWLLGVAGLLALGLLMDQITSKDTGPAPVAPPAVAKPSLNPLAGQGVGAGLAARPLFSPSRRAAADGGDGAVVPFAAPPVAEVVQPAPAADSAAQLLGLIRSPQKVGVVLRAGVGGPVANLVPGETAFGLRLVSVGRDRATFQGADGGQIVLMLPAAQELSQQAAP